MQSDTLWRIPGAVLCSGLVETVGLLPEAGAGEGVAGCLGRRVLPAKHGHPCLGVAISTVGKGGEGSDPGSVGVEKLHSCASTATGTIARYQDH